MSTAVGTGGAGEGRARGKLWVEGGMGTPGMDMDIRGSAMELCEVKVGGQSRGGRKSHRQTLEGQMRKSQTPWRQVSGFHVMDILLELQGRH